MVTSSEVEEDEVEFSKQTGPMDSYKNIKMYKFPPVFLKKESIGSEEFYNIAMSNGSVKVSPSNSDTYCKLIKFLNDIKKSCTARIK